MIRSLALLSLLSTSLLYAQPVEGPYIVIESDSAIHHIHVTARNDSVADIFYQVGNTAYHVAFAVDIGMVYAGPEACVNDGGWTRTIENAVMIEPRWAVVMNDIGPQHNRTLLFRGADSISTMIHVDGDWNQPPFQYSTSSINERIRIWPIQNQDIFLSWTDHWIWWGWFSEAGSDLTLSRIAPSDSVSEPFYPFGNWESIEGAVIPWGLDSINLLSWGYDHMRYCAIDGFQCPNPEFIECSSAPLAIMKTQGGSLQAVGNDREGPLVYAQRGFVVIFPDSGNCVALQELVHNPLAATSHPDFGFAWLSQPSAGLLLNRADTTGALVHPAGVIRWPQEGNQIMESNIALSENGKIMMVWVEQTTDTTAPFKLWIAAVNWLTPLSTTPQPEVVASPSEFILSAYPNPFNSTTTITFDLPQRADVELTLYDITGKRVQTLWNGAMNAGEYQIALHAADLPSGIYFAHLRAGDTRLTQKLMLLK